MKQFEIVPIVIEKCPYCGSKVSLCESSVVYGRAFGKIYICDSYPNCDAYVGCHMGTSFPLGSLANFELREARKRAHFYFDASWKGKSRSKAYQELSRKLNKKLEETHIAMFDLEDCNKVIRLYGKF